MVKGKASVCVCVFMGMNVCICQLRKKQNRKKRKTKNHAVETLQDAQVYQTCWDHILTVNCFIKPIITAVLAERLVKQHVSILTADPRKPFNWVNEHAVILYTVLFTDANSVVGCYEC